MAIFFSSFVLLGPHPHLQLSLTKETNMADTAKLPRKYLLGGGGNCRCGSTLGKPQTFQIYCFSVIKTTHSARHCLNFSSKLHNSFHCLKRLTFWAFLIDFFEISFPNSKVKVYLVWSALWSAVFIHLLLARHVSNST